jgi:PAS domain S-box-containing protein
MQQAQHDNLALQGLLQSLDDLVFLLDQEGRFIHHWVRPEQLPHLFVPPEEFLGKRLQEVLPEALSQQFLPLFQATLTGEKTQAYEYPSPDQQYWYSLVFRLIPNSPGYLIARIQDVTEKRRYQEALEDEVKLRTEALTDVIQNLHKSENILNASQQLGHIGGWEYDLEKQTMWWSDELYRIHGLPVDRHSLEVEKLVSESLNCYAPAAREELTLLFPRAIQGEGYERVCAFKSYDGQDKWVHLVTTPVQEEGKIARVYGIVADITAHKRQELEQENNLAALRISQLRLETAQKLAFMGDWELDHLTGKAYWSATVYQIFEVDPQQFSPSLAGFLDTIHPEDRDSVEAAFNAAIQNKEPYDIVHRLLLADGRIKYVREIGYTEYDAAQQPLITRSAVQDITLLKQTEIALSTAKAVAERASRSKSLFLANMSHEIRTPMNAILGFSQLLKEEITDPRWKRYLKIIHNSGEALLNLINDILDISKIEAGKLDLHLEPLALTPLLTELQELLSPDFEKKQIQLSTKIAPDVPEWAMLDGFRLRQVLLNLLSNALKFTRQGSVTVSLDYEQSPSQGDKLQFKVSDTGMGIAPELRERIFEAFEQANTSYRKDVAGAGLGLSISHQLAHLMGGHLAVQSQVEQGSVFSLTLPFEPGKQAHPQSELPPPQPTQITPSRLLIADDVSDNLFLLEAMLETYPLQIWTAQNGQEACDLAEKYQPDLILMDIKMPIMDGTEALKQLRARPSTRAIPVVALTAFSLQNEQENLLEMGFDAYLSKPVRQEALMQTLYRFLGTHSAPQPENTGPNQAQDMVELPEAHLILTEKEQAELSETLLNRWLPAAQSLQKNMVINEMEEFAHALQQVAVRVSWQTLQTLCQQLQDQLSCFELEAAQQSLNQIIQVLQQKQQTGYQT